MRIRILREDPHVKLPSYANPGDAGMDLYSAEECTINPGETKLVSTGIKMELPPGFEAQVRPKSGLAAKFGITVLNTPGTIDEGYRGVVKVILINHGKAAFKVEKNTKIAQMVIARVERAELEEAQDLQETLRGEGGFGSTGLR